MCEMGEAEAKGMLKVLSVHTATGTYGVFQEFYGSCYQQHLKDSPLSIGTTFPDKEWPGLSLWLGCTVYSGQIRLCSILKGEQRLHHSSTHKTIKFM